MISAKDLFQEEREANYNREEEVHHQQQEEELYSLPVIDLNEIEPKKTGQLMDLGGDKLELVDTTAIELGNKIALAITEGGINPLDFIVKKKLLEQTMAVAFRNPDVKAMAMTELAKYGKSEVRVMGAKLSIFRRPKYNYAEDSRWADLTESIKETTEKIKEQEEKIKTATKQGAALVDQDSGEILATPVNAPATESIAVSFKKK